MMGVLSVRQRSEYLSNGGTSCPFCGSKHMTSEIHQYDRLQGVIDVDVKCTKCGYEWIEVFAMSNVLDADGRE